MYKKKGITKESADDSWFLLSAMVHPQSENRGCIPLIMEDAFANGPNDTFTLVATTPRSRDQYACFGYDILSTYKVGEGKVNSRGLPASGKEAVGVDCYAMVKVRVSSAKHQTRGRGFEPAECHCVVLRRRQLHNPSNIWARTYD